MQRAQGGEKRVILVARGRHIQCVNVSDGENSIKPAEICDVYLSVVGEVLRYFT